MPTPTALTYPTLAAPAQVLQHYATSERERERLAYFASPEGRDDLYECAGGRPPTPTPAC